MEHQPAVKKRRLAPKVEAQATPPPPQYTYESPSAAVSATPGQDATGLHPPERHDFELFARHLQDAAMLIHRQTRRPPYAQVSVLILCWENKDDREPHTSDTDIAALEHVLREQYRYATHRYRIPTSASTSVKLGVRISSFLEHEAADHLFIVFYAGHSFLDANEELYWTSDAGDHATKIKWKGIRCLFEESPSDILFLLDTRAAREEPRQYGTAVKEVLASGRIDSEPRQPSPYSFTAHIAEAFARLDNNRFFTAEHIFHEVVMQRHHELMGDRGVANGSNSLDTQHEQLPLLYKLAAGSGRSLTLFPLPTADAAGESKVSDDAKAPNEDAIIHPSLVAGLTVDDARVLVCTTFVGEASPNMSSFSRWLHKGPDDVSSVCVEGMFLGPPTMLLISMPVSVWNVVQHDKVCCFLGYVHSHNLTHLYERLLQSPNPDKILTTGANPGRTLLEAREMVSSMPASQGHNGRRSTLTGHGLPETPIRPGERVDPQSLSHSATSLSLTYMNSRTGSASKPERNDPEDSAEMQEAAVQLSALSHVRHISDDAGQSSSPLVNGSAKKREYDPAHPHDVNHAGLGSPGLNSSHDITPSKGKTQRRSLAKQLPRQDTRCDHCSHAPFKDTSSLRKHIAAAHTRPFPCAFAFAGCASTFGSKNEWKRHIASQHLCLTYYRCTACPQSTIDGKGNEFNRKDLFTQHLRRMHAPFAIKKALTKGDSKLQVEWETHVKEMQQSCLVIRRRPPHRSACPKPDCASVFEGPTSWDEWTEHVGRHMEKGEAGRLGVDRLLAKWALEEKVIERRGNGEYRLVSGMGSSSVDNGGNNNNNHDSHNLGKDRKNHDTAGLSTAAAEGLGEIQSDHIKPARNDDDDDDDDDEDRTIVAASTLSTSMEVDA